MPSNVNTTAELILLSSFIAVCLELWDRLALISLWADQFRIFRYFWLILSPISIEILHLNIWQLLPLSGECFCVSTCIFFSWFSLFSPLYLVFFPISSSSPSSSQPTKHSNWPCMPSNVNTNAELILLSSFIAVFLYLWDRLALISLWADQFRFFRYFWLILHWDLASQHLTVASLIWWVFLCLHKHFLFVVFAFSPLYLVFFPISFW